MAKQVSVHTFKHVKLKKYEAKQCFFPEVTGHRGVDEAFLHDNTVNQYEQQSAAGVSLETHKSVTTVALMVPSSEIEGVFRLGFQLNACNKACG